MAESVISKRGSRRHHAGRRRGMWAVAAITAALIAGLVVATVKSGRPGGATAPVDEPRTATIAAQSPQPGLGRPIFPYSVIPGGAYSATELRDAVRTDVPVAAHYHSVSLDAVRAEKVGTDRMVYMSYRVKDRIYWTKRKLRLRHGETILTDGVTEIRARCGNCISLEPMGPTDEAEPGEDAFDALADDTRADLGASPLVAPIRISGRPDGSGGGADPGRRGGDPGVFSVPAGGALPIGRMPDITPTTPAATEQAADTAATFPSVNDPVISVPDPTTQLPSDPGTVSPTSRVNRPPTSAMPNVFGAESPSPGGNLVSGTASPPTFPPGPSGGTGNQTSYGPGERGPTSVVQVEPAAPIPTPEPGTIFLVGGGLATLLARRRRRSKA